MASLEADAIRIQTCTFCTGFGFLPANTVGLGGPMGCQWMSAPSWWRLPAEAFVSLRSSMRLRVTSRIKKFKQRDLPVRTSPK